MFEPAGCRLNAIPLNAVTNLRAIKLSDRDVSMEWTASKGSTRFRIEYQQDDDESTTQHVRPARTCTVIGDIVNQNRFR